MTELNDIIQRELTKRLETCKLADRIRFDDSALEELQRISNGDWEYAKLYAGTAVLDALQKNKYTVTAEDIKLVNIFEAINLISGGKEIWDDIQYIGIKAPDMKPEGVQMRRLQSLFDANRTRDSMNAIRDGRLPKYVLTDKIQYNEKGIRSEPEVVVPFRYAPSQEDVEAIAESLAKFISEHIKEPQEVRDISSREGINRDVFGGIQYIVQTEGSGKKEPLLAQRNYRILKSFPIGMPVDVQGVVYITRELLCKHDKNTLDSYVQSVKSQ